uniref:hypothetical protein n=1 Tax=Segatella hominis TaxID=2518605 RepID=UPI00402864EF
MRKEYISPEIKLLVIDELCIVHTSIVDGKNNSSDVVIDGFDVVEKPSEGDDLWDNANNWGGC